MRLMQGPYQNPPESTRSAAHGEPAPRFFRQLTFIIIARLMQVAGETPDKLTIGERQRACEMLGQGEAHRTAQR